MVQLNRAATLIGLITVAALGAAGLGSAAETRSYSLTGFTAVSASAGVRVIVSEGPFAISASEPSGNFDQLIVEQRGSTLVVSRRSHWMWLTPGRHYTVHVSAPAYTKVNASSGSFLSGELTSRALDVDASSGASLRLKGACEAIRASASSGASFDGGDLRCHSANLDVSSGASIRAFADAEAHGNASSGGSMTIYGKPANVTRRSNSGGAVRLADL